MHAGSQASTNVAGIHMKETTGVAPSGDSLLRLPEVIRRVGLRRSAIYAAIKEGHFPRPVRLTKRAVGWASSDIDRWVSSRMNEVGQ